MVLFACNRVENEGQISGGSLVLTCTEKNTLQIKLMLYND